MAAAPPSPRGQQRVFGEADAGVQVPGMGQYRVQMDVTMGGMDESFTQGAGSRVMRGIPVQHAHHQQQQQQQQQQYHQPQQQQHGQFGILAPTPIPQLPVTPHHLQTHNMAFAPEHVDTANGTPVQAESQGGHGGIPEDRLVFDPPDLQTWRERLFNVDEMIVLTNEQYETYWPHVDNVYSHRSTQRYKRKPFISHYWDCRMKGRPSGTPKSDDPNKKKRKRVARERDLCDVKIKVTEYFPGAQIPADDDAAGAAAAAAAQAAGFGGEKFWTVQRVNGNGGNGKGDGVAGPHKHTLERSDEIKKNTVQRLLAKKEKETRKQQKPINRKASGAASTTIKKHAKDSDMKLYAACFCPFSQRVWIALEAKGLPYQYCEIDPYKKPAPTQLLEANPRGLVPAIRQGDWAISESAVILEYLEDLSGDIPLSPTDPRLKANCRLWIDHINSRVVPAFYAVLKHPSDATIPNERLERLQNAITSLLQAADEDGPFFLGATLCLVDVHFAPFALRLETLKLLDPSAASSTEEPVAAGVQTGLQIQPAQRWRRWLDALMAEKSIAKTVSGAELYEDTRGILADNPPPGLVIPR
ncbi:hypothetical protein NLU13_9191 [Sarocladium strictum]|uniref:GST N-terminal domain-containing protein n=1 Tax=Sarocladium strictum TaxID=5046 RepID=A0AA39GAS8_SARSR|nr:hypothetical protein NLU13_9191 [Sarocladium strictum]